MSDTKRIEWCDIYKGIVILLVVIGHYTQHFHNYIYSFHMAAFFFISGYTSNFKKNSMLEVIIKKFISLMMPYLFLGIVGTSLFWALSKWEVLSYVSTTIFPDTYQSAFLAIFNNGAIWCDWLGALWFVPVLFGASIVTKLLLNLFTPKVVFIISVIFFLIGQDMSASGGNVYPADLILIAQYYVTLGYLIKAKGFFEQNECAHINKNIMNIISLLLTIVVVISFLVLGSLWTTDWPAREFNGSIDLLSPILGISVGILFSKILERIKYVKDIFIIMGKYSFAIMSFHFLGFKVFYGLLILLGKENYTILALLTPNDRIRQYIWWGVPVAISIIVSVLLWNLLMKSKFVCICCGKDKCIENYIFSDASFISFKEAYMYVSTLMRDLLDVFTKRVVYLKGCIVVVSLLLLVIFCNNIRTFIGPFQVTFPNSSSQITFDTGWLEQSLDEAYRWIEIDSRAKVFLVDQKSLFIKGYIPDNIANISQVQIFINNKMVYEEEVSPNYLLDITLNIAKYKKIGINDIRIVFDGCRIPHEGDLDVRRFSALIEQLRFE